MGQIHGTPLSSILFLIYINDIVEFCTRIVEYDVVKERVVKAKINEQQRTSQYIKNLEWTYKYDWTHVNGGGTKKR